MKFYEEIQKHKNEKINLFVDMDGVLAEYDIGNFDYQTIRPLKSNIKRVEDLQNQQNITIYILSICKNNKIVEEKLEWFQKYMPFLQQEHIHLISKEQKEYQGKKSSELKSKFLEEYTDKESVSILVDDDNQIIKYIKSHNPNVILFQISSWID